MGFNNESNLIAYLFKVQKPRFIVYQIFTQNSEILGFSIGIPKV